MRLPRLDYPGARHHVMNRGARRAPIFVDDPSRELFLEVLSALPDRFGVQVHAYALMPNHYHLLLESESGGLSRAMRHLGGEYTRRLNLRCEWDGPLFRGRFRNRLVDSDEYWNHLLLYVHLNPVRAGLSPADVAAWTSHLAYLDETDTPDWLTTAAFRDAYGTPQAYLTAYYDELAGRSEPPDGFDEQLLWAPGSTAAVGPEQRRTRDPLGSVQEALADITRATGASLSEIVAKPRGRKGNPIGWLAAWWMSRECGIPHGAIAMALQTDHSGVSRRVRKIEDRLDEPEISAWVATLRKSKKRNT